MPEPKSCYRITYCPQCCQERIWILIRTGFWQCVGHIVEENPWQSTWLKSKCPIISQPAMSCAKPSSDSLGTTETSPLCSEGGSPAPSVLSQETLPGLLGSGNETNGGQDDMD